MSTVRARKPAIKPFVLTKRAEEILKTIHFYRYMTALDVARLLYSPSSLTHVREILSSLAGGTDLKPDQYLYRFQFPNSSIAHTRIFTLGSRGRDFLANEGMAVDWYFRPNKIKHLGYGQIVHALVLTRFCVAAAAWSAKHPDFKLLQTQIYELAKTPATVEVAKAGKIEKAKVIPDAWLLFRRLSDGAHFPILLEIDRGTEYLQKFKHHLLSRIEFIKKGGAYSKQFGHEAVMVTYLTTGDLPEYREARRKTICRWTQEVLADLHKENWSHIFRFASVVFEDLYTIPLFDEPKWYQPNSSTPVPLLIS